MALVKEVFIDPLLAKLGHIPPDPTYGRYLLSYAPEDVHIRALPSIQVRTRRVFYKAASPSSTKVKGFSKTKIEAPAAGDAEQEEYIEVEEGEDVTLTQAEVDRGKGRQWVYYQVWTSESPEAQTGKGRGYDLVVLHGMCDHGAKYAPHVEAFLAMGFRVICPDLASHGRSTGVHVYLDSPYELTEGVHAVLTDVSRWTEDKPRKTFLSGSSLGGWTSLAYALRYPNPPAPLGGLFLCAPLIGVAPETMPPYPVYLLALMLRSFAGRLPLSPAVKGNVSDDPRVEEEFFADERCYHGDLRIATGLSLLRGLNSLLPSASKLSVPIYIAHGDKDRSTDHRRSVEFVTAVINAGRAYAHVSDARCVIYEGYEHCMLKVGIDEADDEKRQRVLGNMKTWLLERI